MSKWLEVSGQHLFKFFILLLLLLIAAYFCLLRPLNIGIVERELQLADLEAEITSIQTKLEQLPENQQTDQALKNLVKAIPNHPNLANLITNIEHIEKKTGVLVDFVQFQLDEAKPLEEIIPEQLGSSLGETEQGIKGIHLALVTIQIDVQGKEEQMLDFIAKLQQLDRIVHVATFHVQKEQDNVITSLTLTTYYSTDFNPYLPEQSLLS